MADAEDLKSSGDFSSWGFDSPPGHHLSLAVSHTSVNRALLRFDFNLRLNGLTMAETMAVLGPGLFNFPTAARMSASSTMAYLSLANWYGARLQRHVVTPRKTTIRHPQVKPARHRDWPLKPGIRSRSKAAWVLSKWRSVGNAANYW